MTGALLALGLLLQEPPVFGVRVESVQVDAYASLDGQPLRDLTAEDFEVKDEGVVQKVELVSREDAPVQAILVLDVSASVVGQRLASLKAAATAFLDGLRSQDRPSLVTFSHQVRLVAAEREPVRAALQAARSGGATSLYDAVYAALQLADPSQGRPVIVLFTDGDDTLSWLSDRQVVEAARESDAVAYVVDARQQARSGVRNSEWAGGSSGVLANAPVTPNQRPLSSAMSPLSPHAQQIPHTAFLRDLSGETGGQVWSTSADASLTDAFLRVLDEVKTRYVLRFEPTGVKREGFHRLEVKLRGRKGDVRTRRGYVRPRPSPDRS